MGLLFPLEARARKSNDQVLHFESHKKKFSLGAMLLFLFLILGFMAIAAEPILTKMLAEGQNIDKALAFLIYTLIFASPVVALACWFYKEKFLIHKNSKGLDVSYCKSFLSFSWQKEEFLNVGKNDFKVINYLDSKNVARLDSEKKGKSNRYGTRGHWLLKLNDKVIERRAHKQDIDWLYDQITHFNDSNTSASNL